MTADEIRSKAALNQERSAFARYEQADWLAEIAAQLAELNTTLSSIVMPDRDGENPTLMVQAVTFEG